MNSGPIDLESKRRQIKEAVNRGIGRIEKEKSNSLEFEFESFKVKGSLKSLDELLGTTKTDSVGGSITDFVDVIQGVTWGGRGAEKVFDLSEDDIRRLNLETYLIYKRIGGEDIKPWHIAWTDRYLLFPYINVQSEWSAAFKLKSEGNAMEQLMIDDALNFNRSIDGLKSQYLAKVCPTMKKG